MNQVKLSDRVRPNSEVAAWVYLEIQALENALAEQAREIESLEAHLESAVNWDISQLKVIHALNEELAALKAQPSGVVPDWLTSSRAFADRLYAAGWRDHADAQHDGVAGMYDELIARLNQPASAGDPCMCGGNPHTTQCLYEHFLSYSGLADQPTLRYAYFHGAGFAAEIDQPSAGGVDERALYEQSCKERAASNGRAYEAHYFKRPAGVGEYLNPGAEHGWQVWQQARAALSANHSEQVRHMVPQMVDFSPVPDDFRSQANGYRAGWNDCRAAIAAAPSAGSQKEQG